MEQCLICTADVAEELQCKWCRNQCHFLCAFGCPVRSEKNQAYFSKGNFACPVCVVGRNNVLTIKAVSTNQTFNQNQNATDFELKNISNITLPIHKEGEYDAESEVSVNGDDDKDTAEAAPPPTPKQTVEAANEVDGVPVTDDFAPIHPGDVTRSKRLSLILNTLKNLPDHKKILILGDSNTHGVRGEDVDPENGTVAVRSFGGLCIVAAVHALQKYKFSYRNIKKVVWSLGTNDALHSHEHCSDDSHKYIKALYKESSRVFPKATVGFILPFSGISGVSEDFKNGLDRALKELCPKIKRHYPPSMRNKMSKGGVHINFSGKRTYIEFLMRQFTKCKPQQQPNTQSRSPPHEPKAGGNDLNPRGRERARDNFRARGPPRFSEERAPPQQSSFMPTNLGTDQQRYMPTQGHPSYSAHELAEVLGHIMMMHRRGLQQQYSLTGQWG